jgi:hypothetical protein
MSLLDIGFRGGKSSFCTAMGEGGYVMLVFDGGNVPQGARPREHFVTSLSLASHFFRASVALDDHH